jgi:cellobiose-specific phosphotransferase system component IIA
MNIAPMSSGLSGIRTGMRDMQKVAHDVATQTIQESPESMMDLTQSMVDLKSSELQVKVSAKVIEAESQVMTSIIDIKV